MYRPIGRKGAQRLAKLLPRKPSHVCDLAPVSQQQSSETPVRLLLGFAASAKRVLRLGYSARLLIVAVASTSRGRGRTLGFAFHVCRPNRDGSRGRNRVRRFAGVTGSDGNPFSTYVSERAYPARGEPEGLARMRNAQTS